MEMTGNTILVTGGSKGIGRGLAERMLREGNQVVIAGRGKEALDEVTAANPGMRSKVLDIENAAEIARFADELQEEFPALNVVIQNAGIMRNEKLVRGTVADAEATIRTNLLGPIRLTAALLPGLVVQPRATVMMVTSGLAFVPLAMTPTYCATKAAIHSYTQSLRYQMKGTSVEVVELVPPYVQTELMGERQKNDPMAMPLKEFLDEVMGLLRAAPGAPEVLVERVKGRRFAERDGGYDEFFTKMNDGMVAARAEEWEGM